MSRKARMGEVDEAMSGLGQENPWFEPGEPFLFI